MDGLKKVFGVLSRTLGAAAVMVLAFTFTALGSGTEDVYANDFDSATPIAVNTDVTDNLASYDEVDCFKFDITSRGYIDITVKTPRQANSNGYWCVVLYNQSYNEIRTKKIYGNSDIYYFPSIGVFPGNTYYMKIVAYGNFSAYRSHYYAYNDSYYSSDNYTFNVAYNAADNWEAEFNDSYVSATEIDLDKSYYGSLHTEDDADYYSFTAPSDGVLDVEFNNDLMGDNRQYYNVSLRDSSYNEIYTYFMSGNVSKHVMPRIGLRAGEKYYIVIWKKNVWSSETYTINTVFIAADDWEKEFNDGYNSATQVDVDKTVYGSMRHQYDNDIFRFEAPEDGQYQLIFDHPILGDNKAYWCIYFDDARYDKISGADVVGNTERTTLTTTLNAGVNYVRIIPKSSNQWDDSTYSFTVKSERAAKEENTDPDLAILEQCPYDSVNGSSYEKIQAFIWRMYMLALGRSEVREDEINYWSRMLYNHERTGADMAFQFCCGAEFKNRNLSDDEFSKIMYRVYMNRERGEGDQDGWTIPLANGANRKWIMAKFVNSPEYTMICWDYGIDRGTLDVPESEAYAPN